MRNDAEVRPYYSIFARPRQRPGAEKEKEGTERKCDENTEKNVARDKLFRKDTVQKKGSTEEQQSGCRFRADERPFFAEEYDAHDHGGDNEGAEY